jgi:hypothetical protein
VTSTMLSRAASSASVLDGVLRARRGDLRAPRACRGHGLMPTRLDAPHGSIDLAMRSSWTPAAPWRGIGGIVCLGVRRVCRPAVGSGSRSVRGRRRPRVRGRRLTRDGPAWLAPWSDSEPSRLSSRYLDEKKGSIWTARPVLRARC